MSCAPARPSVRVHNLTRLPNQVPTIPFATRRRSACPKRQSYSSKSCVPSDAGGDPVGGDSSDPLPLSWATCQRDGRSQPPLTRAATNTPPDCLPGQSPAPARQSSVVYATDALRRNPNNIAVFRRRNSLFAQRPFWEHHLPDMVHQTLRAQHQRKFPSSNER